MQFFFVTDPLSLAFHAFHLVRQIESKPANKININENNNNVAFIGTILVSCNQETCP